MIRAAMIAVVATCAAVMCAAVLGACASSGKAAPSWSDREDSRYVFAYLKTGPNSAGHTPAEKREIFQGHMANMQRLSEERKLVIAGPFAKPTDSSWRGVFVFDVASVGEAQALMVTDPGVSSGEFVGECVEMRATPRLREFLDIYKAQDAKRSAEPRDAGSPPPIRAFVMVTAADHAEATGALTRGGLKDRVVWWGVLQRPEKSAPGGVYVIDAEKAEEVRSALGDGAWVVDGWWSDELLLKIPRDEVGG